jgi:SRSO17 transposase
LVGAVSEADLRASMGRIRGYCDPYRDLLVRPEQGTRLVQMIEGLTSVLERKSVEPIALMHGIERRNLQQFLGTSQWDYDPLREQQRREMAREIGSPDASLVLDGSATPYDGVCRSARATQVSSRRRAPLPALAGRAAVGAGAREDRGEPLLRDPVPHGNARAGPARTR